MCISSISISCSAAATVVVIVETAECYNYRKCYYHLYNLCVTGHSELLQIRLSY